MIVKPASIFLNKLQKINIDDDENTTPSNYKKQTDESFDDDINEGYINPLDII